jgi:hypothetical protein
VDFDKIKSKSKNTSTDTYHLSRLIIILIWVNIFCGFEKWEGIEAFKDLMDEDIDNWTFIKDWNASQKILEKSLFLEAFIRKQINMMRKNDFKLYFYLIR